ncbi:MAG: glycosyltransferase [Thermodesulfobacteriota bacterium]
MTPSIYFLCPDIDIPSGGINRIYRIAKVTGDCGYEAFLLHHQEGFRNRWAPLVPPVRYWGNGLRLRRDDVVVIPESEPGAMRHLPEGIRKVVLALNWSYVFENLPPGERWSEYGVCQVLTPSGVIQEFLAWAMDLPVYRIAVPVDHGAFSYVPENKEPLILYMAHRNPHGDWIQKVFRQLPRPPSSWQWQGVRNMAHSEYAGIMNRAAVFVATGLREGVPGPILEAMASGAVVVGYGGVGGNEYLVPQGEGQNAFQVENEDYSALCRVLDWVLSMMEARDPLIDRVRTNALETVRPLTFEAERESLFRFWRTFLGNG